MAVNAPSTTLVLARTAKIGRGWIEAGLARSSLVPTTPFLDTDVFDWVRPLEAHWTEIRAELDQLLVDPNAGCPAVSADGWETMLYLRHYGMRSPPRAAVRCPRTIELLRQVPGLCAAEFSLLHPDATIEAHRGPYRGVIRYHLALKVPEPADACGLRIGHVTRHWSEGHSLLFDESYPHEAWNHSDGLRAVLFLDVVRPLRQPARAVNALALRAFAWLPTIRQANRRHLAWERDTSRAGS